MKLSISNIAWNKDNEDKVYQWMRSMKYQGLEIAPTKVIQDSPYDNLDKAKKWSNKLKETYSLNVSSMQSIWYGRDEKIFKSEDDRNFLLNYTKKAINFSEAIECHNLVFGCPGNRVVSGKADMGIAVDFFKELGDYAQQHNTVLAMEANPAIYNTNFINDTLAALELIKAVDSGGFMLNLDTGTMVANSESVDILKGNVNYINHVHISEPRLAIIQNRGLHKDLLSLLKLEGYTGYISIEMGLQEDVGVIRTAMEYLVSLQ